MKYATKKLTKTQARPAKQPHCPLCLTPETWVPGKGGGHSSLLNGTCRDRGACETRCPPLFGRPADA